MKKFKNPVSPFDAPDPFMTFDQQTGYYYSLFTRGKKLELFRSRYASQIVTDGDSRIIYEVNDGLYGFYGDIWAPEMHRAPNGKWYIYTSGRISPEPAGEKRLFIMECDSIDPFKGNWIFRGLPAPDLFAIDPTIYTDPNGEQYICYSKLERKYWQVLEIRKLINPYTFSDEVATIARAELDWELVPPYNDNTRIVEGAFFVENKGRLFIIYSANGCWSDDYCLGVLEHLGGSLLDPANWKKHEKPLFVHANEVYGPGHASFFYSPDKKELWCAYHGMKNHNEKVTNAPRYFNIQRVDFDETGYPVMGKPTGYDVELDSPSGEIE